MDPRHLLNWYLLLRLFATNQHINMCPGMARFSQQRQFWTRQPTNVKVSTVVNSCCLSFVDKVYENQFKLTWYLLALGVPSPLTSRPNVPVFLHICTALQLQCNNIIYVTKTKSSRFGVSESRWKQMVTSERLAKPLREKNLNFCTILQNSTFCVQG